MGDKDNKKIRFKASSMNSKLQKMPLSQNPMMGMQDLMKTKLKDFGNLKINEKIEILNDIKKNLYENIRDDLQNVNYILIHKNFLQLSSDNSNISDLKKIFDNAKKYDEVEVKQKAAESALNNKLKLKAKGF